VRILEELTDLLSHLGNMANLIDSKMIISINITQTRSLEKIFLGMGFGILSTSFSKGYVRTKFPQLLQSFIELVYSLGFNMEEIQEAYFTKMSENYLRFI
jgi:dimeric dUTPase (all-alpha-NTP-PPase superfamily)